MDMQKERQQEYVMQQTLQQQQIDAQMAAQSPYMMQNFKENQAILVEQTNPQRVVEEIELTLKGLERKSDGTYRRRGEPLMNDFGVNSLFPLMKSLINQGTILSHYEKKEIMRIMKEISNKLADELMLNWKEYGIKDKSHLDTVFMVIVFPAYSAMNRALEQNEKNWLSKISVENITNSPKISNAKKESFWSKLKL